MSAQERRQRVRVLVVHTHPIQYLSPLFRLYANDPSIDLMVAYCEIPPEGGLFDNDFGIPTDWGVDLLSGYASVALGRNRKRLRRWRISVIRLILRGRFDLVVAYGYNYPTSWFSLLGARLSRTRWAFAGDTFTLASQRGRAWFGKRSFLHAFGRVADGVIAQSIKSAEFYRQFFRSVHLVPHAVDEHRFASSENSQTHLPSRRDGEIVFLFVGKLIARKNVEDAIEALRHVPGASLWIVGRGPDEERLRSLAAPLLDRVSFLGFRDQREMPSVYAAADVLVLPSSIETFGLVVSEAAAAGTPSIVSDACGVVGSVVVDGVTGVVFEARDTQALSAAMLRVTEPGFRDFLKSNMADRISEWSTQTNARAFTNACLRLIRVDPAEGGRS